MLKISSSAILLAGTIIAMFHSGLKADYLLAPPSVRAIEMEKKKIVPVISLTKARVEKTSKKLSQAFDGISNDAAFHSAVRRKDMTAIKAILTGNKHLIECFRDHIKAREALASEILGADPHDSSFYYDILRAKGKEINTENLHSAIREHLNRGPISQADFNSKLYESLFGSSKKLDTSL